MNPMPARSMMMFAVTTRPVLDQPIHAAATPRVVASAPPATCW